MTGFIGANTHRPRLGDCLHQIRRTIQKMMRSLLKARFFKIYYINQWFKYLSHHAPNAFKKTPKQFMLVCR